MTDSKFSLLLLVGLLKLALFNRGFSQILQQGLFKRVKKDWNNVSTLETGIISSHRTGSWLECSQRCLQSTTCVFFNHNLARRNNEVNCQIGDWIEIPDDSDNENDWTLYKRFGFKTVCTIVNPCRNGGECRTNTSAPEGYDCVCKIRYQGRHCETNAVFKSCKAIRELNSAATNGVYRIQATTALGYTNAYCHMTSLDGCAREGWTLVMKIDGRKDTFHYSSTYWSEETSFNPDGGLSGLNQEEAKLPTYWSTPFHHLCVGMNVSGTTKFVSINHTANSLYGLIADGQYRATNIGRAKWKSLITGSSLQRNCNKEGFNVNSRSSQNAGFRLGIAGNEGADCASPDSFVGFGGQKTQLVCTKRALGSDLNICGNFAGCSSDNGDVIIKAMGYIFVR